MNIIQHWNLILPLLECIPQALYLKAFNLFKIKHMQLYALKEKTNSLSGSPFPSTHLLPIEAPFTANMQFWLIGSESGSIWPLQNRSLNALWSHQGNHIWIIIAYNKEYVTVLFFILPQFIIIINFQMILDDTQNFSIWLKKESVMTKWYVSAATCIL